MKISKPQSAGGKATAIILREKALKSYYNSPNKCLKCCSIILPKEKQKISEVRKKKFCNQSCATSYNNNKTPKIIKKEKQKKEKIPKFNYLKFKTKGEVFKEKKWQTARAIIQKHARFVYQNSDNKKCCYHCGYDRHYEVAHKNAVCNFSDESRIVDEINDIKNLIALCPTHHWEFDNGFLKIDV